MSNLKINWKLEIQDLIIISLGLLCYSIGYYCFLVPHQVTPGGTTGLGSLIFYATGWFKPLMDVFHCQRDFAGNGLEGARLEVLFENVLCHRSALRVPCRGGRWFALSLGG